MFDKKYKKSPIELEILIYEIMQEHVALYHADDAGEFNERLFRELIMGNRENLDRTKWRIAMLENKLDAK